MLETGGDGAASDSISVPCSTLDNWVERLKLKLEELSFIKIDVQGWEVQVLRGASRLLAQDHIVWKVEVQPAHMESARVVPNELFEILERHFTHFVDVNKEASGARVRETSELREAMSYLENGNKESKTDVLLHKARTA